MKISKKRKGFSYTCTDEQIEAYSRLTLREKLEWLAAANSFCEKFVTGTRQIIWEKFRRGEI